MNKQHSIYYYDQNSQVGTKKNTINDGDLTISSTDGLQSALDDKQDEIISTTDLTLNSITSNDLIVNKTLNVDNVITYETNQFNTIVIRRFDETNFETINLNELQCWVNNVNIMVLPTNN